MSSRQKIKNPSFLYDWFIKRLNENSSENKDAKINDESDSVRSDPIHQMETGTTKKDVKEKSPESSLEDIISTSKKVQKTLKFVMVGTLIYFFIMLGFLMLDRIFRNGTVSSAPENNDR
ncbi:hypothetical protein JTB14_017220 [Gonioctena quinquepunctata]|nr:hypothetical protein JTB14_017220 [Gonioctena quinquepunctata]